MTRHEILLRGAFVWAASLEEWSSDLLRETFAYDPDSGSITTGYKGGTVAFALGVHAPLFRSRPLMMRAKTPDIDLPWTVWRIVPDDILGVTVELFG